MQEPSLDGTELQPAPPRHRPLVPVLIGFATGVGIDGTLQPPFSFWLVLGCTVLILTLWAIRRGLKPWGHWVMAVVLLVPIGGAYHCARVRDKTSRHLSNLLTEDIWRCYVRGKITSEPELHVSAYAFPDEGDEPPQFFLCHMQVESLSADDRNWFRTDGGLTVFVGADRPDLLPGDEIEFLGAIRRNRAPSNPGEPDFRAIYDRQGSNGTAALLAGAAFELRHRPPWYSSIRVAVGRLRSCLKDKLIWHAARPIHPITGALIFGDRGRLGPHLSDLLSEAGAFHFLAISGLHVGIFAAFVWAVLRWVRMPVRLRPVILIGLIWLYALFTGLHVSALRAALMLSIIAAAPLVERRYDSLSALVGAALIILLISPQQLFTAGFQFTFLAVWAVIYLYQELARVLWPWDELVARVQEPAAKPFSSDFVFYTRRYLLLSASVWLAVAPVTAYHFHSFSFLTPFINLLLWPLVLLLILSSFLLTLSVVLAGLLQGVLMWVTDFFSLHIEALLDVASRVPGFVLHSANHPIWWVATFYTVLIVWVLRARVRAGRAAFLAGVLVLGVTHIFTDVGARRSDALTVVVADVGHGQCVTFKLPSGAAMLYDAGAAAASRVEGVAGILREGRARRIQKLLISHRDADHCNFVPDLARRFGIGEVLIPPNTRPELPLRLDGRLEALGLRRRLCTEDARLTGEGLECVVIHPNDRFLAEPTLSENEKSLVLMCRFGHCKILLTGDIQEHSLRRLAEDYGEALRADVLLLPHHGELGPGLREFVELVRPRIALASCDREPGPVRQLLDGMGVPLWTTAEHGAVVMEVRTDEILVSGFRSGRSERFGLAGHGPDDPFPAAVGAMGR